MPQDLNRFFQVEAEDLLGRIAGALEPPAAQLTAGETLRELRRWTHTLKGAAQVVGRDDIAQSAHHLETLLDRLDDPAERESALGDALRTTDAMRRTLFGAATSPAQPEVAAELGPPESPEVETPRIESMRIDLRDLDGLLQNVNEAAILAGGAQRCVDLLARAQEVASMLRHEAARGLADGASHVERLATEVEDVLARMRRDLDSFSANISRSLDDLRARAEDLRLVRAETIVQVLGHSVRAAATGSGKQVAFEAAGSDLEFDAHVLIAVRDALIQIVRNAVAHGIELPQQRVARGKAVTGTIRVTFRHQGGRNLIEVQDDGSGIDFGALRDQAIERGWLTAEESARASSQDLTDLILRPGVTTSASPSIMAGRGVGLDLVSRTVARLKGELRVRTEPGHGTTFAISVPASISSIAALIVNAGGRKAAIPRDAVRRTVALKTLEKLADTWVVDGRPLPLVPLAAVMGGDSGPTPVAAVIDAVSQPFLLGLDAVLGIRQVVLHTLPEFVQAEPFVIGASVDACGSVLPIVSPLLMAPQFDGHLRHHPKNAESSAKPLPILIIDDSLTTRMLEQSIFEMEGYSVDLASSAEEALTLAMVRPYGLFLVDVEMPGMDGVEFIGKIKQEPTLRDIPAILVTSRGSAEDRARGLKAGARDYIAKNEFDQRYLIRRVRELIRAEQ